MPDASDDIDLLWEHFLAAKLDDEAAEILIAWFESHPEDLDRRRQDAALSSSLECLLGPVAASRRLVASVQARVEGTAAGHGSGRFRQRVMDSLPRNVRRPARKKQRRTATPVGLWPAAAAAIIIAALILFVMNTPRTPEIVVSPAPQPAPTPSPVKLAVADPALLGTLSLRSGSAIIENKSIASGNVALKAGDRIELADGARAEIVLNDGTRVELGDASRLQMLSPQTGNRLHLTHGSADVHAAKQSEGKQFVIETAQANVRVVGTQYIVQAFDRFSRVAVSEGKVAVAAASGEKPVDGGQLLNGGEEVVIDSRGLEPVKTSASRRVLPASDGALEQFADPASSTDVSAARFQEMPLRRFSYTRPARKDALGYSGLTWPVSTSAGEENFDVWIRPRWIKPDKEEFRLAKIVMLAQMGSTEYRIGVIEVYKEEKDWIVLRGRLTNAAIHWIEPGTKQIPLRADLIQHIALRTEIGSMEFEHTGIIVWKDALRK